MKTITRREFLKVGGAGLVYLLVPKIVKTSTDLEFILQSSEQPFSPLPGGTVVLQGISDPNYLEIKETDENGSAIFSVQDSNFFYFFGFKQGYHPKSGAVFSSDNKRIPLELEPFQPDEWQYYYKTDGKLEMSFISFDKDTNYEWGDEFNYEVEIGSVSDEEIHLSNFDIKSGVYNETNNPVVVEGEIWGSPNPFITYNIYLKPKKGWIRYTAQGNKVTAIIGESYGVFNGTSFDVSGEGEWVSKTIQTNDNVVPEGLPSGNYHVLIEILGLKIKSQDFYIKAPSSNFVSEDKTTLERKLLAFPNPARDKFRIRGCRPNERIRIYDLLGRKIYDGPVGNVDLSDYKSGTYIGVIGKNKIPITKIK